ncbi:MAG: SRPBCC family protein, partial [Myxococcota bacterium]
MELGREIEASAERVWHVVGERFGDMSWSSGITRSNLEGELGAGAVRVCQFPPNMFSKDGQVRERLLSFDRDTMRLSYEAGPTGPMKRATNRWSVVALGRQRCRVDMRATV